MPPIAGIIVDKFLGDAGALQTNDPHGIEIKVLIGVAAGAIRHLEQGIISTLEQRDDTLGQ